MKYLMAKKLFSLALSGFYSKISFHGLEAIPADQPVLFISNHCNALVDPLLLLTHWDRNVTLTAKRTLARNLLVNMIIKSFSIVLFSRSCDREKEESGKTFNTVALDRLQKQLRDNGAVFIFPEGKSHNDENLHRFKNGAAKLALNYGKNSGPLHAKNDLLIVPLALAYSNKAAFRSSASVKVGTPLSLLAWLTEHPHDDSQTLTKQFRSMVEDTLAMQKGMAREFDRPIQDATSTSRLGTRFKSWEKRIIGAPFSALGWLLNALPFGFTALLMQLLSTDHDHPASTAIVVGPPIFVVAHALQLICVGLFGSAFLAMLYLVLLIPSTVLALKLFDQVFKSSERSQTHSHR